MAVWWDERLRTAPHAAVRPAAASKPPQLAHVDLDCDYLRGCVLAALARRPAWRVVLGEPESAEECTCPADAAFSWSEYERVDWERVLAGRLQTAAYCVRKGLIRKSHLAHCVKKWVAKRPGCCLTTGVPETVLFELHDAEYLDEALADAYEVRDMAIDGSEWWIAKPSMTNQARGIFIFNRLEEFVAAMQLEDAADVREWVLQRYVHPPLLVGGRKFHLRLYALAVGSLTVWVWPDVLALFSLEAYCDDPARLRAHITNTCVQAPQSQEEEAACVCLLAQLPERLQAEAGMSPEEAAERCERVFSDAAALVGEAFAAVSSELSFQALPNAFELFGFDLLVDAQWRVWLVCCYAPSGN